MARGPRPDPDQAAKGFPGRRRTKAARAAEQQERLAALLAPAVDAKADLPAMLLDAKYRPAAEVWRKLAPELRRTHRLPLESEHAFVTYCIYVQEWVANTEDLHANGFFQSIKTVAGGKMERKRPAEGVRQQAFSNMTLLADKFGLTPMDMYALFKGQAAVAPTNPGLFGEDRRAPDQPAEADNGGTGLIGSLAGLRSLPPGERAN